jgi:ribosomal protein S18 acetylase RimI-like enzyme
MPVTVRPVREADLEPLSRLDLSYPADRFLAVERSGQAPEHAFVLRWRRREPAVKTYATYTADGLRMALTRADLFMAAEVEGAAAGLLMALVPRWTDAAEITDLAVGAERRRQGAGSALVRSAMEWAGQRGLRGVWVEPRADNYQAIEFYQALGFRVAGLNDRWNSNLDHEDGLATIYMFQEIV